MSTRLFLLTGCIALSSCAVTYENVAGSWSCSRVDGVCEDIDSVDKGLIQADGFDVNPVPLADVMERSDTSDESLPAIPSNDTNKDTTSISYDGSIDHTEESENLLDHYDETDGTKVPHGTSIDSSDWNELNRYENLPTPHSETEETPQPSSELNLHSATTDTDRLGTEFDGDTATKHSFVPPALRTELNDTSENNNGDREYSQLAESKSKNNNASKVDKTQNRIPEGIEEKLAKHPEPQSEEEYGSRSSSKYPRTNIDEIDETKKNSNLKEQRFVSSRKNPRASNQPSIETDIPSSSKFRYSGPSPSSRHPRQLPRTNSVSRSPEKFAKIVFAPVIDSNGNYHEERSIYIVVEPSHWILKRSNND